MERVICSFHKTGANTTYANTDQESGLAAHMQREAGRFGELMKSGNRE